MSCNRPSWIALNGFKYCVCDYLFVDWREDDLPVFGQIKEILVVNHKVILFKVVLYETLGVDRHYHSFVLQCENTCLLYSFSELKDYQPMRAHMLNTKLYLTLHRHVENINV